MQVAPGCACLQRSKPSNFESLLMPKGESLAHCGDVSSLGLGLGLLKGEMRIKISGQLD